MIQCDHGAYKNYCYRRHSEKVVVVPVTINKAIVNINCVRVGEGGKARTTNQGIGTESFCWMCVKYEKDPKTTVPQTKRVKSMIDKRSSGQR